MSVKLPARDTQLRGYHDFHRGLSMCGRSRPELTARAVQASLEWGIE